MTTQAQEIEKIARRMAKGKGLPWHLFMPDASIEYAKQVREALKKESKDDDAKELLG